MTVYAGFDVLETPTDRSQGVTDDYGRSAFLLDSTTGARSVDATDPAPAVKRSATWVCFTRGEVATLRAFLDARKGTAVPFWMPSWDEDMTPAADISGGATTITVLSMRYTTDVFPAGPMHRYIAVISGSTVLYRKITGSVDNGNGTETITLDAAIGSPLTAASTIISFLRLCRLDSDDIEILWQSGQVARALLPMVELPGEVPA